jgi:predicted TIM-barrel fold metal-dependent hydrolase
MLKIDAFPHILPRPYLEMARPRAQGPLARLLDQYEGLTALHDLDRRFRVMDQFGEYLQVLTLVQPAVDSFGQGAVAADLARCANDSMAELCHRHPDRFVGFAAAMALRGFAGQPLSARRRVRILASGVNSGKQEEAVQRISYVDPASLTDPELVEIVEYARRNGTPPSGEPGDPRPRARAAPHVHRGVADRVPRRRARPPHQGALPPVRLPDGGLPVLRTAASVR